MVMFRTMLIASLFLFLSVKVLSFGLLNPVRHRGLSAGSQAERKNLGNPNSSIPAVVDLIHPKAFFAYTNKRIVLERTSRLSSTPNNNVPNENIDIWDDEEEKNEESTEQRRRLRDWMYSGASSPLVQPVQWEDELPPKEERKTVKPSFGNLFDGMPKLNEILNSNDYDETTTPSVTETTVSNDEDSWFDEERQAIQQEYDSVRQEMIKTLENDDSTPDNAMAVVDSVLKQEMERELQETKEKRLREQLEAYEKDLIQRNRDLPEKPPEAVMQLIDQSEQEFVRSEKIRKRVEDYQQYERSVQESYNEDEISGDKPIEDVNAWAVERLKALVDDDSTDNDEASEMIKDILRENLEDLSERMNRPAMKGNSMKEWQMYRAIASRMDETKPDETEILKRLEAWKEYNSREEDLRQRNGLSGPGESSTEVAKDQTTLSREARKQQRIQTRKTLNRMSIEALESLLLTTDESRRQKLQEEIDFLKTALEQNDYLDVDESTLDDEASYDSNIPVDMANLFKGQSGGVDEQERERRPAQVAALDSDLITPTETLMKPSKSEPPPDTPFFSDVVSAEPSLSLGSMEEQKLEAMYRRSGATTEEERSAIRKSYEEFKSFEETKRQASGLSSDDAPGDLMATDLRFNVSSIMTEDGDFDAETVLSAIGPRPVRTKKTTDPNVADSLYRAVSAVGGGKYKDNAEMDARQKASYLEFIEKEAQVRMSIDDDEAMGSANTSSDRPISLDDEKYAEEVIAALGQRPQPKRGRFLSAQELSDRGGLRPGAVDDLDEDDEDEEEFELGLVPEWLKKENSAEKRATKTLRGKDVDDAFDDSYYEHNARQLAEFERRRRGLGKTMGIDISDVLGRSSVESDDYADFKFDDPYFRASQADWGSSSFLARKQNLLEYIELELEEVNSLMEHKDSVYATGFSQYLPRINKPFVEFGAIFRLESVLIDTSGLHVSAWKIIAEENNFREPSLNDIQKAALVRAEEAVKDVFFWTNDVRECRQIALRHLELLRSNFDQWMAANNINRKDFAESSSPGPSTEKPLEPPKHAAQSSRKLSEREFLDKAKADWSEVAERIGEDPPTEDEIIIAFTVGVEIAVKEIFGWASDSHEIDRIVDIFNEVSGVPEDKGTKKGESKGVGSGLTRGEVMEAHYRAWLAAAGKYQLRPPSADEVLAAFVKNDPEAAANGFGWEGDSVKDAVKYFSDQVEEALSRLGLSPAARVSQTLQSESEPARVVTPLPLKDFDLQTRVWSSIATRERYAKPDNDEILFAMSVGPEDAIVNGFGWGRQPDEVARLVEMYYRTLEEETRLPVVNRLPPIAQIERTEEPNLDVVFQGIYDSWMATARQLGYAEPTMEEVQFAMTVGLEEAIMFGLQWTQDRIEVSKIVKTYRDELAQRRSLWSKQREQSSTQAAKEPTVTVQLRPGVYRWVKSLVDVEMQCCVVSNLDQDQVNILLNYFGLAELFPHRVSASNGYSTSKDQLLGAALRLERRPDHCVVFDAVPESGASDITMRSVGVVNPYPRFELVTNDVTSGSLEDLTAMDVRRLFTERVDDQTQVDVQQPQEQILRKTKTSFFYDDD